MGKVSIYVEGDCVQVVECVLPVLLVSSPRVCYISTFNSSFVRGQDTTSFHLGLVCCECRNSWLVKLRFRLHEILINSGFSRMASSKTVEGICPSCVRRDSEVPVISGHFETMVRKINLS